MGVRGQHSGGSGPWLHVPPGLGCHPTGSLLMGQPGSSLLVGGTLRGGTELPEGHGLGHIRAGRCQAGLLL